MDEKISFRQYLLVGSLLFGMMFGAGNLIFPVHLGQEAGGANVIATLGFLITAVGMPFLGVMAMGISGCKSLPELASRVHPLYAKALTVALYITIGPAFALPRTGTVSYEIGLAPYLGAQVQTMALGIFTACFFLIALAFSLKPSKILIWVGKLLNPLFLVFLAGLIIQALLNPMGVVSSIPAQGDYTSFAFFKGFTEGYNTMDVLAALAFAIVVVRSFTDMGVRSVQGMAKGIMKSGIVSVVLMCVIYSALSWMGASSMGKLALSKNGGIALAQIANYYFGSAGAVLLAIIVTLACLKTAIGLITSCSEAFVEMFPSSVGYKSYVYIFTLISFLVSNVGLTHIIALAIPVLMLLYPLAITLILLTFAAAVVGNRREMYVVTTLFTLIAAIGDMLSVLPAEVQTAPFIHSLLSLYRSLPFFNVGMGWIIPALLGFFLSFLCRKRFA